MEAEAINLPAVRESDYWRQPRPDVLAENGAKVAAEQSSSSKTSLILLCILAHFKSQILVGKSMRDNEPDETDQYH